MHTTRRFTPSDARTLWRPRQAVVWLRGGMTQGQLSSRKRPSARLTLHGRELRTDLVWRTTSVPGSSPAATFARARSSASRQRSVRAAWRSLLVHQHLREIERDAGERRGGNVVCFGAVVSAGKHGSRSAFYQPCYQTERLDQNREHLKPPQQAAEAWTNLVFPLSHPGGRRFESG